MGPLDFRAGCEALRDARATPTMPEYFGAHGYRTLGAGKVFHGSSATTTFQEYGPRGGFGPYPEKGRKFSGAPGERLWDWGRFPERDEDTPDHEVANWAIARLQESGNRPFFLALGFFRPHVPMYAPATWWNLVGEEETITLPPFLATDREDIGEYAQALTYSAGAPRHTWFEQSGEWRRAVHAYLACVSFVDAQIGRVLAALAASAHSRNTIVVLFGDHGWALGEKQRWAKRALWERETKVPLSVSAPGFNGGRSCAEPAGLIDIYPTLIDLCGLPAAAHLEGRTLRPQLRDPTVPRDPVVTTAFVNSHAVRSRHHRYIRYADGSEELYDHRVDPNEWRNVASRPENVYTHKQTPA